MKKKILSFVFAICLIIPCLFAISACGDKGEKTINVNIFELRDSLGQNLLIENGVEDIELYEYDSENKSTGNKYGKDVGSADMRVPVPEKRSVALVFTFEAGYSNTELEVYVDDVEVEGVALSTENNKEAKWMFAYPITSSLDKEHIIRTAGKVALRTHKVSFGASDPSEFNVSENVAAYENVVFSLTYNKVGYSNDFPLFEGSNKLTYEQFKNAILSETAYDVQYGAVVKMGINTINARDNQDRKVVYSYLSSCMNSTASEEVKFEYLDPCIGYTSTVINQDETLYFRGFSTVELTAYVEWFVSYDYANMLFSDYTITDGFKDTLLEEQYGNPDRGNIIFDKYLKALSVLVSHSFSKTHYDVLTNESTIISINDKNYTYAELVEKGMVSFDSTENPTKITYKLTNMGLDQYVMLSIKVITNKESLLQSDKFHQIDFKIDTSDNQTAPYAVAKWSEMSDIYIDNALYLECTTNWNENNPSFATDCTISENYKAYYHEEDILKCEVVVAYVSEKTSQDEWRSKFVNEEYSFTLVFNDSILVKFTGVFDEDVRVHKWTVVGDACDWVEVGDSSYGQGEGYGYTDGCVRIKIKPNVYKSINNEDLSSVTIKMSDINA